jgi:hypothetical protein
MRKEYDGRFSHENKEWAKSVPLPQLTGDQHAYYGCEAHPAILDGFINRVREQQRERKPSVIKPLQEQAKTKQPHNTKKGPVKKDPER